MHSNFEWWCLSSGAEGIDKMNMIRVTMQQQVHSKSIENIIDYFQNTMKGVKSLEYRIWARSYVKNKGDYEKLANIRYTIRKIRKQLLELPTNK